MFIKLLLSDMTYFTLACVSEFIGNDNDVFLQLHSSRNLHRTAMATVLHMLEQSEK